MAFDANGDARNGDWIQTANGRVFWPIDPRPEEVHLDDIAHALAHQVRFAGHCRGAYSVAQHCVLVAQLAQRMTTMQHIVKAALLHDASEAYVIDVPRPLKPFLAGYKEIESRVQDAIAIRFGLEPGCFDDPLIKHCDNVMLSTERRDIMAEPPRAWLTLPDPDSHVIRVWDWAEARDKFLAAAETLGIS